jgi:sigma-B regulation protein RsbU (phosphoserine phosphatase)
MTAQPQGERRRAERMLLEPPLEALLTGRPVTLCEIGLAGGRIEHDAAIVGDGQQQKLTIEWAGEQIVLDCTVARSERLPIEGATRFTSGLSFSGAQARPLQRIVAAISAREEIERLQTIVEASKLINSSIEADSLFNSILSVARDELEVERGTLYFVDDVRREIWSKIAEGINARELRLPIGKGLAGSVAETGEPVILHDAYSDPRFDSTSDLRSGYRTRSMLCVAIHNRERRIVGVLQLLNKKHGSFGPRDIEFLDAISDHMAIAMENATLHIEILEKNRMQRELQLGREIQSRLLPPPPSDIKRTKIGASSVPCYEVGGDYFDFIEYKNGDIGLAIGDVSGKGVASAMIMASIQAALRVAAPLEPDLASLMTRLNQLLFRMAGGRKYVTFFFARYSPATGEMRYVNAGHNPPYIVHEGTLQQIDATGRPIGILPDAQYEEGTVTLPDGATLFLYTDGLNEAADPEEEEFGNDRLRDLVLAASNDDVDRVAPVILDTIARFERGAHATDDKTIVVVRRDR